MSHAPIMSRDAAPMKYACALLFAIAVLPSSAFAKQDCRAAAAVCDTGHEGSLALIEGGTPLPVLVDQGEHAPVLRAALAQATIAFADHRDIEVILGAGSETEADSHEARILAAAARAFAAFPQLRRIATTLRGQDSVDAHTLGALLVTRSGDVHRIGPRALDGIVDRIGAGDAFAAGVLHGLLGGMADGDALAFGHAAACLKHTVPGDFNLVDAAAVEALGADASVQRPCCDCMKQ